MQEKRKHPRAHGLWDVTVWMAGTDVSGDQEWQGEVVDFSPGGLKVKLDGDLRPGATVTLIFTPPDGGPMVSTQATAVRKDAKGHSFAFASSLSYADFVRLKKMVKART